MIPVHAADRDDRAGTPYLAPDFPVLEVIDPQAGLTSPLGQREVRVELLLTRIDREYVPPVRFRMRGQGIAWSVPWGSNLTGARLRIGRMDGMLILRSPNL